MRDNKDKLNGSGYGYVDTTRIAKGINRNWVCIEDRFTTRRNYYHDAVKYAPICPHCNKHMVDVGYKARVPKKSASKRTWANFRKLFNNYFS